MTEVIRYLASYAPYEGLDLNGQCARHDGDYFVRAADFDRVTAERDAALAELGRYQSLFNQAQKAIDRLNELHRKRMAEIGRRLTAADERADTATSLIQRIVANFDTEIEFHEDVAPNDLEHDQVLAEMRVFLAALKPAEGGGDD